MEATRLQGLLDQRRVAGVVFQMKDAERTIHDHARLTLPGGGSLMSAQKTPSSLTAFTNS
jgi:hypothetical protein